MTKLSTLLAGAAVAAALAACGGGGSGGSGSAGTPSATRNQLFAYDGAHRVFAGLPSLTLTAGANTVNVLTPASVPTGGLAYDSQRDLLYATVLDGIAVYEHASQLAGNIAPARTIRVDPAVATKVEYLAYDKQHDILYATGQRGSSGGTVFLAFNAPAGLSGTVTPSRQARPFPSGPFAIDTVRNILYIRDAGLAGTAVFKFKNLDTLGSTSQPESIGMFFDGGGHVLSVAVDAAHDRLYYVAEYEGVRFVDQASTHDSYVNGRQTYLPTTLLSVPAPQDLFAIAYDPGADRLYTAGGSIAYQFDGVSKIAAGNRTTTALAAQLPAGVHVSAIALP